MKTIVTKIDEQNIDDKALAALKEAGEIIKNGGLVAFPTETVYGLGGDGLNPESSKKIYAAKGRPSDNPLIVHVADMESIKKIVKELPDAAYKLADALWPGPLTMIVPKSQRVPKETSGGLDTVGIRMPSHPVIRELIKLSTPIAAPSANRSGYPSPTTAEHVYRDMKGRISAVIDGGECRFGVESTVICFENEKTVRILRPGSVTEKMLSEYADVIIDEAILHDLQKGRAAPSPGMKYKHYSPKADVKIVEGSMEQFADYTNGKCGEDVYCLIFDNDSADTLKCKALTYGADSTQQAHELFAKLRELDDIKAKTVYVRSPDKTGVGLAVYNRLLRAAAFEVIKP